VEDEALFLKLKKTECAIANQKKSTTPIDREKKEGKDAGPTSVIIQQKAR